MKIEIGESLVYSYLRHKKSCIITQTNWKPSSKWLIPNDTIEHARYEFNRINKHHAFSDIFKSDFDQTIKQAEIDVLGMDNEKRIYAFEVAFHENGLQYSGKIETRNRIFKKLLRGFITLKCFFPGYIYSIAFCSPKVNPATEQHIKDYFEVLISDFQSDTIQFIYISNEKFSQEILFETLESTVAESDNNELFIRAYKLLNLADRFKLKQEIITEPPFVTNTNIDGRNTVTIKGKQIPLSKENHESVQDFVKRIMELLIIQNLLPETEIQNLLDKDYCKKTFFLQFPLIRKIEQGYKDNSGKGRYWTKDFGGKYYVCSQWWKDHHPTYLKNITRWLKDLADK